MRRSLSAAGTASRSRPKLVVLDEPTSALDVSLRSRIILLLEQLRAQLGLAYLFISHDIATVKYLAERIAVMYLGAIVDEGEAGSIIRAPLHPYFLPGAITAYPDGMGPPAGKARLVALRGGSQGLPACPPRAVAAAIDLAAVAATTDDHLAAAAQAQKQPARDRS